MTAPEIRKKMEDRNLTVVADRIGVSYGRLRRWFLGNETALKLDEIYKLAEYLK